MKLKAINTLLIIAMLSLPALAQPQGNGPHQGGQMSPSMSQGERNPEAMMAQKLGLSSEQMDQMKAIKLNNQKEMLPLKNTLGEKEAKLKSLQTAPNADMKAINSQLDEIGALKIKMAKVKASGHQEVRKLLSDDQRIMFDTQFAAMGDSEKLRGGKGPRGAGKAPGQGE
ncbi:MAG: Spy/CpxP family protein refolding chaperone [Marinoscillum sp.]|jgi:Spy/CpxP family protein refolding chaperone